MSQDLNPNPEQGTEQQEEQPDAIQLLAERLAAIESALGVGNSDPSQSNLLGRLSAIEEGLTKSERERRLPEAITRAQASDPSFLRRAGIDLKDFTTGRVKIIGG